MVDGGFKPVEVDRTQLFGSGKAGADDVDHAGFGNEVVVFVQRIRRAVQAD